MTAPFSIVLSQTVGSRHAATAYRDVTLLKETVFIPVFHVIFYVIPNFISLLDIPDIVLVKSGLPCKFNSMFVSKSRNGSFHTPDDYR